MLSRPYQSKEDSQGSKRVTRMFLHINTAKVVCSQNLSGFEIFATLVVCDGNESQSNSAVLPSQKARLLAQRPLRKACPTFQAWNASRHLLHVIYARRITAKCATFFIIGINSTERVLAQTFVFLFVIRRNLQILNKHTKYSKLLYRINFHCERG